MRVVKCGGEVEIKVPTRDGNSVEYKSFKKTMKDFLQASFDNFDQFAHGHVNGRLYDKLCKVLDAGPRDGEFWFEDDDFKKVQDAVKGATWFDAKINRAYLPFYDAVEVARVEPLATEKK